MVRGLPIEGEEKSYPWSFISPFFLNCGRYMGDCIIRVFIKLGRFIMKNTTILIAGVILSFNIPLMGAPANMDFKQCWNNSCGAGCPSGSWCTPEGLACRVAYATCGVTASGGSDGTPLVDVFDTPNNPFQYGPDFARYVLAKSCPANGAALLDAQMMAVGYGNNANTPLWKILQTNPPATPSGASSDAYVLMGELGGGDLHTCLPGQPCSVGTCNTGVRYCWVLDPKVNNEYAYDANHPRCKDSIAQPFMNSRNGSAICGGPTLSCKTNQSSVCNPHNCNPNLAVERQ